MPLRRVANGLTAVVALSLLPLSAQALSSDVSDASYGMGWV